MSFGRSVATVGGLTLLSRILGFARDVLSTAVLGAGPIADAALVAFRLPNLFRRLFAEGAFSSAFVPLFTGTLESEGRQAAALFAEEAQAVMLLVLVPFTILAEIFMPQVIHAIAPGFSVGTTRYDLAVVLSRITFPYLVLISLSALQGGVLNALDLYWPFASAPLIFNFCLICGFALRPIMPTEGHSLAYGQAAAGVLQFLWMLVACRRAGILLRLRRPRMTPAVKRLFVVMGPVALGAGAAQVNVYVDQVIASFLPTGAISYLYYADRLGQLPLGVIGTAVGTALLPLLSRHAKAGRLRELADDTARAVEMSLLLALPAAIALIVSAQPIIAALFVRGKFTAEDAVGTGNALAAYSIGIPAFVLAKILSAGFFARQDTRSPVKFSLVSIVANTAISLSTIHWLGYVGIALATGLTAWLNAGLLARRLARDNLLAFGRMRFALPRLAVASLGMTAVLLVVQHYLRPCWTGPTWERAAGLTVLVGTGGSVYLGIAAWTRVLDVAAVRNMVRRQRS